MRTPFVLAAALLALVACKKSDEAKAGKSSLTKIGLVTDVGGRGDKSFNDGALRGLENWAAGKRYTARGYEPLPEADLLKTIPEDLKNSGIQPLPVQPVVLQAKKQEDYESNLQTLVDDQAQLAVAVGFMLEGAVESAAKKNPAAKFLLIDSPLLDRDSKPYELPNVRSVVFREHEGTFLVGALAGLATRSNVVGFVGGMQIPLIRKFEAGFRAGVAAANPKATVLVDYTGTFDRVEAGKQSGQIMISKGADVLFHAAGADGLGAIAAARDAKKWAIGCDSDQHPDAPETVIASFIKHVDFAVWKAVSDLAAGKFTAGPVELGLKEGGVGYSSAGLDKLPNKDEVVARLEALRKAVAEGTLKVPATLDELAVFQPPPQP